MQYAIEILKTEKYKLIETIAAIDKYAVHPAYTVPPQYKDYRNKLDEINRAIEVLNAN